MTDLTVRTCEGIDGRASCGDAPPLGLQCQFALAYIGLVARRAAALAWFVLWRLVRLRWPVLRTTLLPSRTGGAGGGPMCWDAPAGPLGSLDSAAGARCTDLRVVSLVRFWRAERDRVGAPVVPVVVERWSAAGWQMRGAVAIN